MKAIESVAVRLRRRAAVVGLGLGICCARGGIPEPDLVWYGRVVNNAGGTPVRVVTGTLTWQIEPLAGGAPLVLTTVLTNIHDQFSYVLRVPCESPEPGGALSTNALNLTSPAQSYRRVSVTLDGQPLTLTTAPATFGPVPAQRGTLDQVDLHFGGAITDADGDGLPDAWEQQFFGAAGANPGDDADADGVSNLREYRAGTNPTDANSRFEIVEVERGAGGAAIRWSSQPGKVYRIRRAPTLLANAADYQLVQGGLAATPPVNEFTDPAAAAGAQFFYLIELEP